MIVRSKAPLRISFGGGGTDVPPYPQERGGAVLSTTINKYAYGTLVCTDSDSIEVKSLDYDVVAKYHAEEDLFYDGKLDLVKAVIRNMAQEKKGFRLFLHSDAPPGSGLGSSSTMVVTLIGLFTHLNANHLSNYELAELAYKIERQDLNIPGGLQDQYAAAFGGFNFIEFRKGSVVVNPLRIDREVINELEYRLLLCYTGSTRISANILNDQVNGYVTGQDDVVEALDRTKEIAYAMKDALLQGKLDSFGNLLHEAWVHKQRFSSKITSPHINGLYEAAREEGVLGGKLLGAGGGGYLLLLCPFDRRHKIAERMEKMGGQMVDFGFESKGLQSWQVKEE